MQKNSKKLIHITNKYQNDYFDNKIEYKYL